MQKKFYYKFTYIIRFAAVQFHCDIAVGWFFC